MKFFSTSGSLPAETGEDGGCPISSGLTTQTLRTREGGRPQQEPKEGSSVRSTMLPLTQRAVASAPVKTAGSKYGVGSLRAAVRDTTLGKLRALAAEGPRELTAFRDPPGRLFASIGVFAGAVVDRLPVRAADLFRRIWYGLIAYLSFFPATLARCRLATVGIAATPQDSLLLSP